MTFGRATGFEAQRGDRNEIGAMQRDETMRGAHEFNIVVITAASRVTHQLGDWQLFDRLA